MSTMSLTRAFTTKKVKMSLELAQEAKERAAMQRSNTTKAAHTFASSGVNSTFRPKISAPLELIHTTNMLSYNAPDIYPQTATSMTSTTSASSSASMKSDDDSDSPATVTSSPPTSPDIAPDERCSSPEPNHLSCYFMAPGQTSALVSPVAATPAPIIPQRAPSHTKKASFDALNRKRSTSRMSKESSRSVSTKASFTFSSRSSSSSSATSHASMHSQLSKIPATPVTTEAPVIPRVPSLSRKIELQPEPQVQEPEPHPFVQELAQVTEIAEEFGITDKLQVIDEEEQDLLSRGLCKFSADAYLSEIQGLASYFNNEPTHLRPMATVWI